jgi:hypothetical protein
MKDHKHDLPPALEQEWREWATTEPAIDESQLRRDLLQRIPDRKPRPRMRLVLAATAASLVTVSIGIEISRRQAATVVSEESVVYETGSNVILVVREGMEPIYIATARSTGEGE